MVTHSPDIQNQNISERLSLNIKEWENIGASNYILDIIKNGAPLHFHTYPIHSNEKYFQQITNKEDAPILDEYVKSLLQKNAIQLDSTPPTINAHFSRLFTVPKKDTTIRRPVLNLTPLNKFIQRKRFRMEGIHVLKRLLRRGYYMTKVDISEAFYHIKIRKSFRRFLSILSSPSRDLPTTHE